MIKKLVPLATLLLFSWFQGFQLCDEAQDAAQALSTYSSLGAAHKAVSWRPASGAYDDADASFPLVVGQTLLHSSAVLRVETNLSRVVSMRHLATGAMIKPLSLGRSPPSDFLSQAVPSLNSLIFARNPAHCLAPPFSNLIIPQ